MVPLTLTEKTSANNMRKKTERPAFEVTKCKPWFGHPEFGTNFGPQGEMRMETQSVLTKSKKDFACPHCGEMIRYGDEVLRFNLFHDIQLSPDGMTVWGRQNKVHGTIHFGCADPFLDTLGKERYEDDRRSIQDAIEAVRQAKLDSGSTKVPWVNDNTCQGMSPDEILDYAFTSKLDRASFRLLCKNHGQDFEAVAARVKQRAAEIPGASMDQLAKMGARIDALVRRIEALEAERGQF